jgi:hypothetical protein
MCLNKTLHVWVLNKDVLLLKEVRIMQPKICLLSSGMWQLLHIDKNMCWNTFQHQACSFYLFYTQSLKETVVAACLKVHKLYRLQIHLNVILIPPWFINWPFEKNSLKNCMIHSLYPPFQWWNGFIGASACTVVYVSTELNHIWTFTEKLNTLISLCQESKNRAEEEDFKFMWGCV